MNLKLIIKGFVVGVGKIIPGVSGSMLAVFMGIYEPLMEAVTRFFDDKKKHFKMLVNFLMGVFLAVVLFSKVILFLLNNYYYMTIYLFLGLILGTTIKFGKKVCFSKKNIIIFSITFSLVFLLNFFQNNSLYVFQNNFFSYLYVVLLGGIDAFSSIVPGISGTAIFMMMGSYEFILMVLGNPFSFLFYLYGLGMILGIILTCYLMSYLLRKRRKEVNMVILALAVASMGLLFLRVRENISFSTGLMLIMGIGGGYFLDK